LFKENVLILNIFEEIDLFLFFFFNAQNFISKSTRSQKKKVDNSNYDGEGTNIKRKRKNYIKMSRVLFCTKFYIRSPRFLILSINFQNLKKL
jgi:hypothetical protein